uniref:Odorant-binding protein 9 n=1 Tax=Yemma signatus TaxID=300820 RepID=A0A3G2GRU6_9HEMI|nr:odorant-binding protein 9 [Yemma signatus]
MYKILAVAVCCLAAFTSADFPVEHKDVMNECRMKVGLSIEEYRAIDESSVSKSDKAKCFFLCMMEDKKMLKDGKVNWDFVKMELKKLQSERPEVQKKIKGVYEGCFNEVKNTGNNCNYAYDIMTCIIKRKSEAAEIPEDASLPTR